MYKEKVLVTSNDVDSHLKLKISALFKFLQQASTNHSEILRIGRSATSDVGKAWVITRMWVKINKLPDLNDEIIVCTHPGDTMKFIYPRFYEVYSKKGELLVSGSALWVVIDAKTRHVLSKPFDDKTVKGEKNKDDIAIPERVQLNEVNLIENRQVRYSDIDLNGHLNNVKYIEFMMDLHDKDFYDQYTVKEILINYEKECHDSDVISLYRNDSLDCSIKGMIGEVTTFTAKIGFVKR